MSPGPSPLLLGVPAAEVERVAAVFGLEIAEANVQVGARLAEDDAVSPTALMAGLIQAHLQGAASAVASAGRAGMLQVEDAMSIVLATADVMGAAITEALAGGPSAGLAK